MGRRRRTLEQKKKIISLLEKLHPMQFEKGLIRIGSDGDGGYLVPNDMEGIQACFSPGVGTLSEFEGWCLKHKIKTFMADKSVDKVNLDVPTKQYSFIKKYIGCTNNDDFITLDKWVESSVPAKNSELLLQMDIEGGEYNSLIATTDELMKRFRIILIEFHSLQELWRPAFFHFANIVFNKILQTHTCVHIHPNNCEKMDSRNGIKIPVVAEFSFLRHDRIQSREYASVFPHPLDCDNGINKRHLVLPKNWYRSS